MPTARKGATYAQVAAIANAPKAQAQVQAKPTPKPKTAVRINNRLFIRLGLEYPARKAGSFAILIIFKRRLGLDTSLIKEVQEVSSGYALVTSNLEKLQSYSEEIAKIFTDCTIKRATNWTIYRLNNIPRSVTLLKDSGSLINREITSELFNKAILNATE